MDAVILPFERQSGSLRDRSDDDLMLLASGGMREAFEELIRRHAERVVAFCTKSVGNASLGEEMAQEVWLSVWDQRSNYRAEGKFVVWLFTMARNRVRNAFRERTLTQAPDGVTHDPPDSSPSELDKLIAEERRVRLDDALARLSPALREAVILRFAHELPYVEIARVVATNESTARSRVFHGLRDLRRRLGGGS